MKSADSNCRCYNKEFILFCVGLFVVITMLATFFFIRPTNQQEFPSTSKKNPSKNYKLDKSQTTSSEKMGFKSVWTDDDNLNKLKGTYLEKDFLSTSRSPNHHVHVRRWSEEECIFDPSSGQNKKTIQWLIPLCYVGVIVIFALAITFVFYCLGVVIQFQKWSPSYQSTSCDSFVI